MNTHKFMEDAYNECLKNSTCMSYVSDEATILNALYNGYANNPMMSLEMKYKKNEEVY